MTTLQIVLIALFGLLGGAKVARIPYMVDAAADLGFTSRQYQLIGAVELLAVAGLLLGFVWLPLALAAGVGLMLQMFCALLLHLRNRDGARHLAPAVVVLALAAAFVLPRV